MSNKITCTIWTDLFLKSGLCFLNILAWLRLEILALSAMHSHGLCNAPLHISFPTLMISFCAHRMWLWSHKACTALRAYSACSVHYNIITDSLLLCRTIECMLQVQKLSPLSKLFHWTKYFLYFPSLQYYILHSFLKLTSSLRPCSLSLTVTSVLTRLFIR